MDTGIHDVEAYLAALPAESRATLEEVRRTIRAAAPDAVEAMSYAMPAFKQNGSLVCYAAFKQHCSFFPMSMNVLEMFEDEVKPYRTSKGTLQFPIGQPLPAELVTKIVRARTAENEARRAKRKAK